MSWVMALVFKPFFTLAFFTIVFGIVSAISRWMPENKLKRTLFIRINQ